jgi:hypothetical protein
LYDDRVKEFEKVKKNKEIVQNFNDQYQKYKLLALNKQRYNTELNKFRLNRTRHKDEKMKVLDTLVVGDRLETEPNQKNLLDLLMFEKDNIIEPPLLTLPNMNEKLFVERTIGKYVNRLTYQGT